MVPVLMFGGSNPNPNFFRFSSPFYTLPSTVGRSESCLFFQTHMVCFVQCCGSGMFIPDPDFYSFRIPDPKTANTTFFCSHKFHKIENYFIFLNAEEKNLGQFSKNYRTYYTTKICH